MAVAVILALWSRRERRTPHATQAEAASGPEPLEAPARSAPEPLPRASGSHGYAADPAIHGALGEVTEAVPSRVVVEAIDMDRPWVCAGDPVRVSARVGGEVEAGAIYRWVWRNEGKRAELHPGPAISWTAPEAPGRYGVHFQVCKDLGGRRVGVLAGREATIEVRACAENERQAHELLRVRVSQRKPGTFEFEAAYGGRGAIEHYAWDFGDGRTEITKEARVEHTYAAEKKPGAQEVTSYSTKVRVRTAAGEGLEATAMALTREQTPEREPLPVDFEVTRWRPGPDGNGFQSDVTVTNVAGEDVAWDHVERTTKYWDDRVEAGTRAFEEVIAVDERLPGGGFRGRVRVSAEESRPEVKQILDALYGQTAAGKEVVVSWTPFKRAARPLPHAPEAPPEK